MEPGIYFEAKPVFGLPILGYHGYLVYRDGMGTVEVIRGGTAWYRPFFLGGNITVETGIPLHRSKDKYPEPGIMPKDRYRKKLDLGDLTPDQLKDRWEASVIAAENMPL